MIPDGWELKQFDKYYDILSGIGFKLSEYSDSGIKLLRIDNVSYGEITWDSIAYLPETYKENYSKVLLKENDILLALNRPITRGKLKIARLSSEHAPCILYQRVGKIEFKSSIIDKTFSYYLLSKEIKSFVEETSVGSDQPFISVVALRKLTLSFPPLPEQKKIATILSSIDKAIQTTQNVIDQTQKVKKGLLQELLTKGIGHTEFKKTEIGEIPVEWEVGRVSEVIALMKSGLSRRIVTQDIGIPVMISGNIQNGKLYTKNIKYWYRNDPQGADINNYILNDGDLLLCFINSLAQIGKLCIFYNIGRDSIYTTNLFRIIPKENISSEFLYYLFSTPYFQEEIQLITKPAVNQASFTKDDFLKIKVPIIPQKEQDKIVKQLIGIDQELDSNISSIYSLKSVKKGLMQDLLTGKVRVKV